MISSMENQSYWIDTPYGRFLLARQLVPNAATTAGSYQWQWFIVAQSK